MPRGLSAAAKAYQGPIRWAVKLTLLDSSVFNYSQESIIFLGVPYEPYLESVAPVRLTRTLEADSTEIVLRNVDLTIGDLLRTKALDGAQCTVRLLLLAIGEAIDILPGGVLREEEQDQHLARFQVTSRLDPSLLSVTSRKFTTTDFPIISPSMIRRVRETPGSPTGPGEPGGARVTLGCGRRVECRSSHITQSPPGQLTRLRERVRCRAES